MKLPRDIIRPNPAGPGRQGHAPKIRAAIEALRADGSLPPHLRPSQRDRRILDWLMKAGYSPDLPGRDAIRRFLAREGG